ncbi:MAG TPA: hypothetical protein VHG35_05835, partial [Gemmatimonadales bacterium]|nr:hypothetical protein [Gemmatimonadales bacterium]
VERIRAWLETHGIVLAGRYSEWEYYNSDHAFIAGMNAARAVQEWDRRGDQAPVGQSPETAAGRARAG